MYVELAGETVETQSHFVVTSLVTVLLGLIAHNPKLAELVNQLHSISLSDPVVTRVEFSTGLVYWLYVSRLSQRKLT